MFLSNEAERKATSANTISKKPQTTRNITSEQGSRKHVINKRLLDEIQRKVPIYSRGEFDSTHNSGSSINWQQN